MDAAARQLEDIIAADTEYWAAYVLLGFVKALSGLASAAPQMTLYEAAEITQ